MNIKKLFATLAGVSLFAQTVVPFGALAATYSQELQDAYNWAYGKSITTKATIDDANMYGAITRAELAKMLANWAKDRGQTPDTSKSCTFSDTASVQGDLAVAIVESCQLGLMGQLSNGNTSFRPYDTITRAEFGTALSRALWGTQYEGGTPYYARHLDALKSAGIMNQIANAESTKEIRGYVMLMLMRSEGAAPAVDCEDALVKSACLLDAESCPAACKTTDEPKDEEPTVVKSGDLAVSAKASTDRKAIVTGAVSDLDTLTFRTSEEVEITKIVLERYGYSTRDDVKGVWLEDEDGNIIAESKALNTKDQVTLNIKKDYRKVDGVYNATIVLETSDTAKAGGTIGFKVISADSTAKNLNLDDYRPYEYDMVNYDGATVSIDAKGTAKDYNYTAGESYEVARLKVNAASSAISVNGFTLTNKATNDVDVERYLDKVVVLADGQKVSGLKYNVNKSKELVVSFDEVEVASKKSATFVVSISFTDDFNDYGRSIQYAIDKQGNFNAVEKKTGARLTVELPAANAWVAHQFNGSKIRLTNVKTTNVEAAAGSEDVVVAEGSITVSETVSMPEFVITGKNIGIDNIKLVIAGEEYDGSNRTVNAAGKAAVDTAEAKIKAIKNVIAILEGTGVDKITTANQASLGISSADAKAITPSGDLNGYTLNGLKTTHLNNAEAALTTAKSNTEVTFKFSGIEIEKSGKVVVKVDLSKDAEGTASFLPTSLGRDLFSGARYVDARQPVQTGDVAGSISFTSKLTVQAAKAALENNLTKTVEFMKNETNRKVVFDGTYTARKGDVYLNKFSIDGTAIAGDKNDVEYYVFIDGEEVGNTSALKSEEIFSDVLVKNGTSVKVKVEVSVTADDTADRTYNVSLALEGEDADGNKAGVATEAMKTFKTVNKGAINVEKTASKNTIELRQANAPLASFVVKPANAGDEIMFEDIELTVYTGGLKAQTVSADQLRVKVDGVEQYDPTSGTTGFVYDVNENIPSEGITVTVDLKSDIAGEYTVEIARINDNKTVRTYHKNLVDAVVRIAKQEDLNGTTKFTLAVEGKADSSYTLSGFCVADAKNNPTLTGCYAGEFSDGDSFEVTGTGSVKMIKYITYEVVGGNNVEVEYDNYSDYFKVNGADARVYRVSNN